MNANELADELEDCEPYNIKDTYLLNTAATMLRQQQAEIEGLKIGFAGNGTSDSELAEVRAQANRWFLKIKEQQDRIGVLEANYKIQLNIVEKKQDYIDQLEQGLRASINLNKAQAERNNEPVAWMNPKTLECGHGGNVDWEDTGCIPLYTSPRTHDLGIADAIGFERGYKAATAKKLTNEEILCLWDWWSGEILSTDILDFADTYKRVLLGEEGLLEWHKEYVKKMNEQYPSGKVTEK